MGAVPGFCGAKLHGFMARKHLGQPPVNAWGQSRAVLPLHSGEEGWGEGGIKGALDFGTPLEYRWFVEFN